MVRHLVTVFVAAMILALFDGGIALADPILRRSERRRQPTSATCTDPEPGKCSSQASGS